MLKVYKECCGNCLLSKDRIVSPKRAKDLLKEIAERQSYFVCHKASVNGEEIVCKTFFDKLGHQSQMIRIAERLNVVQFIEQNNTEKLIPYRSITERGKSIK
jgi:uncharacterized protein YerC